MKQADFLMLFMLHFIKMYVFNLKLDTSKLEQQETAKLLFDLKFVSVIKKPLHGFLWFENKSIF